MIQLAKSMNFNTLVFLVYSHGKAMYNSSIIPRWQEIEQGFDPLAYASRRCHEEDLRIYAWSVCYYSGLWSNLSTPGYYPPNHVLVAHPEWITQDINGGHNNDDEIFLDPGIPDVKQYLRSIVGEIIGYDIDGVVLDYIRYDSEYSGHNPLAISQFQAQNGYVPTEDWDPLWRQWRIDQVTDLVRLISQDIRARDPNVGLGAAVWGDYTMGLEWFFQDSEAWMREGLVNFVATMTYTTDQAVFTNNNQFYLQNCYDSLVFPGIGVFNFTDQNNSFGMANMIQAARDLGAPGIHLFALNDLEGKQEFINTVKEAFPSSTSGVSWPMVGGIITAGVVMGAMAYLVLSRMRKTTTS
jgi:uncharacterized lipoprotein YddW (UPF0748 family)